MPSAIEAFHPHTPEAELADLRARLERTRWPDQLEGSAWSYGTDRDALRALLDHWKKGFDWHAWEGRIARFDNFATEAQAERLHFIHARSPRADARPLVLTHGWPGSVVEFLDVIDPLRDPEAHGAPGAPAFHVVCPSMPGYGYSGPTRQPGFDVHRVADAVADLMRALGYERYVAQGGDWGAIVTRRLAEHYGERLLGAHFNMLFAMPDLSDSSVWAEVEPAELEAFQAAAARVADGTGYMAIQGTKPQTLAYGLNDSPAGLCAWILEKFHAWVDGPLEDVLSPDQLLANISLYWFSGTANSAARLYCESLRAGTAATDAWQGRVEIPVGFCQYPGELLQTPRAWAERRYAQIVHWTRAPRGGHFAAFEQPEFFVDDLRAFARTLPAG